MEVFNYADNETLPPITITTTVIVILNALIAKTKAGLRQILMTDRKKANLAQPNLQVTTIITTLSAMIPILQEAKPGQCMILQPVIHGECITAKAAKAKLPVIIAW